MLRRHGERYQLEDLNSRNGTRVNGRLVEEETTLNSGDEIAVGPFRALLSISRTAVSRRRLGSTALLDERLLAECDRSKRYSRRFALLMLRIEANPDEIDEALAYLATQLRPMDTLCEYAPDLFALVIPEASQRSATTLAQRLVSSIQRRFPTLTKGLQIGLAVYPDNGTNADKLLSNARAALQSAIASEKEITGPPEEHSGTDIVVVDPQAIRVFELIDKIAPSEISVLILGETGVGKEVIASAIHRKSNRTNNPYIRLNCASIPESLLESELFGHEKGAFTGALSMKKGYFEAADKGTIFLDEIGEITSNVQAKLLRVLESRTIVRVGGTKEINVNVRVLYATNRNLEVEIKENRFREDLYYRISGFTVLIPALRDRPLDIIPLCEHFLTESAKLNRSPTPVLSEQARSKLQSYDWPGNIRQLRNAMERAVVLASDGIVEIADLPDRVRTTVDSSALIVDGTGDLRDQLATVEKATIVTALEATGGNQTRAAKHIGMSRRAFIYKMEKYGLKKPPGMSS